MQLTDLKRRVKSLAENDQSIVDTDIIDWIDDAIKRINQTLEANFPMTNGQPDTYEPQFDKNFHEILLMFCEMRYRESDADFNSANYYKKEFDDMLLYMQKEMIIPPSFRVDELVQQIVVTDPTILTYTLTMNNSGYFGGTFSVYQNDNLINDAYYTVSYPNSNITFIGLTVAANDKFTIVFEDNADLNQPPYGWWAQSEW